MKTEAETGGMCLQAKEFAATSDSQKQGERLGVECLRASRETSPADLRLNQADLNLDPRLCLQKQEGTHVYSFKPPSTSPVMADTGNSYRTLGSGLYRVDFQYVDAG